jgi:hypothetical protein
MLQTVIITGLIVLSLLPVVVTQLMRLDDSDCVRKAKFSMDLSERITKGDEYIGVNQ